MITDKDRENFELWLRTYCFQAPRERDYQLMKDVWLESAEQVRKEAAERVRKVMNVSEGGSDTIDKICAAILSTPTPVSTDSEKLAIAVKALEYVICQDVNPTTTELSPTTRIRLCSTKARDALKEIQG